MHFIIKGLQNLWQSGSCGDGAGLGMPSQGWRGELLTYRCWHFLTSDCVSADSNARPGIGIATLWLWRWKLPTRCRLIITDFLSFCSLPPPVISNCTHEAKLLTWNNPVFLHFSFFWQWILNLPYVLFWLKYCCESVLASCKLSWKGQDMAVLQKEGNREEEK